MVRWLVSLLILVLLISGTWFWFSWEQGDWAITLNALEYPGSLRVDEKEEINFFLKEVEKSIPQKELALKPYRYKLTLTKNKKINNYYLDDPSALFREETGEGLTTTPELQEYLHAKIKELHKSTPFGAPLEWDEVKEIFPRYTLAVITDVETDKSFQGERRGGTFHADVQPLTARDTQVLKEVYKGRWSWQRRAVVVEIGGRKIAASMNGMPHGSGKIQGNDFLGHFCIHFLQSRVHKSGKVDLAHQMMVWKAAGRPEYLFNKASPEQIINLVLTALDQRDERLLALGLLSAKGNDINSASRKLVQEIASIALGKMEPVEIGENPDCKEYNVKVEFYYRNEQAKREKQGPLNVLTDPATGRHFLELESLEDLLAK